MNFQTTLEQLDKLYDESSSRQTCATRGKLEEGIFDKKRKNTAEYHNQRNDFESKIESISKEGDLLGIAFRLGDCVLTAVRELGFFSKKKDNHASYKSQIQHTLEPNGKLVLRQLTDLLKKLKSPTNFVAPASYVGNIVNELVGSWDNSKAMKTIDRLKEELLAISNIDADKKLKQDILKDFYKQVSYNIEDVLNTLKQRNPLEFFLEDVTETGDDKLIEDADEEILIDDEPVEDDEAAQEEAADEADEADEAEEAVEETEEVQLVLECSTCGALALKTEADVEIDAETTLANIKEECQYCEEAKGYKIIGTLAPYAATEEEPIEEGIFGFGKKKKAGSNKQGSDNSKANQEYKVTITIYDENGKEQYSHVFKELPGKMKAEEQLNELIRSNGVLSRYKASKNKYDWSYERKSEPASNFDTDRRFHPASKIIRESIEEASKNQFKMVWGPFSCLEDPANHIYKLYFNERKLVAKFEKSALFFCKSWDKPENGRQMGRYNDSLYTAVRDFIFDYDKSESYLNMITAEKGKDTLDSIRDLIKGGYISIIPDESLDTGLDEFLDISVPVTATVTANGNNVPFMNGMTK